MAWFFDNNEKDYYNLEETVYVPDIREDYFKWKVGWIIGVTTDGNQSQLEYKITHQKNETVEGYWIPNELVYNQEDYMETFH